MTRNLLVRTMALLVLFSPVPSSLPAQAIRVTVVEAGTGGPASSSLVSLLTESGERLVQKLADEFGRATLPFPGPGRYLVRGDRIGFVGHTSDPVSIASGDTITLRLILPVTPFVLPEVAVRADLRCTTTGVERRDISLVWEEARKALTSTLLTREQFRPMLQVQGYEREWDATDHLVREDTSFARRGTGAPFRTLPVDTLLLEGFSREESGTRMFYAPDAGTLLSDGFLGTHCFTLVSDGHDGERRVGLTFEPALGRTVPDIAGTLWLRSGGNLLQEVEFEYRNVEAPWDVHRARGVVRFERIAGLGWIVNGWQIQMPRVVIEVEKPPLNARTMSGSGLGRVTRVEETDRAPEAAATSRRLVRRGMVEQSGTAALAESGSIRRGHGAAGGDITGVVYDSILGVGLAGAAVSLAESHGVVRTDSTGRYHLSVGAGGPARVRVSHPMLDLFGVPSTHEVVVQAGGIVRLNVATPGVDSWLAEECGRKAARNPRLGALVGQLPDSLPGGAKRRGKVQVTWVTGSVTQPGSRVVTVVRRGNLDVTTDDQGRFQICEIPLGVPLRLRVNGEFDYQLPPLSPARRVAVFPSDVP